MNNKVLSLLTSILMIFSIFTTICYADSNRVSATYDYSSEELKISVNIGNGTELASLTAFFKDTDEVLIAEQFTTNAEGSYELRVPFSRLKTGYYDIYLGAESLSELEQVQIYFNASQVPESDPEIIVPEQPVITPGGGGGGGGGSTSIVVDNEAMPEIVPPTPIEDIYEGFSDLSSHPWAEEAINALAKAKVISGMGDGKYEPQANVTREQFAKMLICAFELDIVEGTTPYEDLDEEKWSYPYLVSAYKYGIMSGYSETTLGGEETITRQDMAVMLVRALDVVDVSLEEGEAAFSDDNEIADYAKTAVKMLKNAGIVSGMEDNTFAPKTPVTRAMAAVVLYKAMDIIG